MNQSFDTNIGMQSLDRKIARAINLPSMTAEAEEQASVPAPPQRTKPSKPILVLDMDETILHSEVEQFSGYDKEFSIQVNPETKYLQKDYTRSDIQVFVTFRPGLVQFLGLMYRYYSIIIWTMGVPDYAGPVLDYVEEKVKL